MFLPSDKFILLSLINTKLRDGYSSLEELCEAEDLNAEEITSRLSSIGFTYDEQLNCFK